MSATKAQHAPGPWFTTAAHYVRYGVQPFGHANICDLDVFGGSEPERDANARLIAAAPDLLAACEAAAYVLRDEPAVLALLDHAIAKARGEQP